MATKAGSKSLTKRMGFLVAATDRDWRPYINAFENELKQSHWKVNGQGGGPDVLTIDYQPAGGARGDPGTLSSVANAFVQNQVDIMVTSGTQPTQACMYAPTKTPIPIVFAAAGDPVGSGLVANLKTPGGRVTGCTNLQTDQSILSARIKLMQGRLNTTKVGVVGNVDCDAVDSAIDLARNTLSGAGIAIASRDPGRFRYSDFQNTATIQNKLSTWHNESVTALYVCSDPTLTTHLDDLVTEAGKLGMQTMHEIREAHGHHVNQTYGSNFRLLFTKAAERANLILRGRDPGTIEVYVPDTTEQEPA
jgi:putative ABC transport system substrate-binding protein